MGEMELKFWELNIVRGSSLLPWKRYLGQLFGQQSCNHMIYTHEEQQNRRYSWIVRLRLDSLFFAPCPPYPRVPPHNNVIWSWAPGRDMFIDAFNVGSPNIMHPFLDRVFDFGRQVRFPAGDAPLWSVLYPWFNPEDYVKAWLKYYQKGEIWRMEGLYTFPFRYAHERSRIPGEAENAVPWTPAGVEPGAKDTWRPYPVTGEQLHH